MKIIYSAPAKVILSGEHAVVYGKPALVFTINLRLQFSLWEEKKDISEKNVLFISKEVKSYLKNHKIIFLDKPFNFKIESEVPVGRGLGSSAALSVASVAAFLEFYAGRQFEKEIINDVAFQIEKYFHKNPSGIDNTASCFGNVNFKIPKKIREKLLLIDTGKPIETTGEMVNFVGTKDVKNILDEIEITTNKFQESIKNDDEDLFRKCLVDNEKLLERLEVVSEKTKKLLADLSRFGFGKVTGAGGQQTNSGFILFLTDDKKRLEEFLKGKKISYYYFILDDKGLQKYEN